MRIKKYIPLLFVIIVFILLIGQCNKNKSELEKSEKLLFAAVQENKNLQLEVKMTKEQVYQYDGYIKNLIDSLKKKPKFIKSIDYVVIRDSIVGNGEVVIDTVFIDTHKFTSYTYNVDTLCYRVSINTNDSIFPNFSYKFVIDPIKIIGFVEYHRPKNWFWKLKWNKTKWPTTKEVHTNCGEIDKNINIEIK